MRFSRMRAGVLAVATLLFAIPSEPVRAEWPPRPLMRPSEVQQLYEQWHREYDRIVADLKVGTPKANGRAKEKAYAVFEEIVDRAISGETLCASAGRFLVVLAIAEYRVGDPDAAAWHWQMAQNVAEDLRRLRFQDFPDVTEFMGANLIADNMWAPSQRAPDRETPVAEPGPAPPVEPPRIRYKVEPRYPAGLRGRQISGTTAIFAIIDSDGKVRQPVVRRGCGLVSLDLAAMEAVREWRYYPATLGGRPVKVFLTVNVAFRASQ